MKHYQNSSPKNFVVIPVTQDMIFNFVDTLATFFKKTIHNKEKDKFKISQYKVFEYSNEHETQVRCGKTSNFVVFHDFIIQKRPNDCPNIRKTKLYTNPLPIKKNKYDNIMHLAKEYVPKADIDYYTSLMSDEGSQALADQETDVTDNGEFSTSE